MAKTLYFTIAPATTHRGNNDLNLVGVASWWEPTLLSESRGASGSGYSQQTSLTPGASAGIEVVNAGAGAIKREWLSEPLSADFTIAGTITLNLWSHEFSMTDNAAVNATIFKVDAATGALTQIAKTARVTELGTASAINNFTVTPTSTVCKRGDRIRMVVWFDDVASFGTSAAAYFAFDRNAAGVLGDSYVTFTENLTFEAGGDPGIVTILSGTDDTTPVPIGDTTATQARGQRFVAGPLLTQATFHPTKSGSPSDNLIVEIQSDSGGVPSGTVVGTVATYSGATAGGIKTENVSIALTSGNTYWLVFRRSGAIDAANYYYINAGTNLGWASSYVYNGTTWGTPSPPLFVSLTFIDRTAVPTYYLTDTAEVINPGIATEKKALTTRGSGVTNAVTNTSAGPTTGIQITSAGSLAEWYTPPLEAFTLGGKAKFNIRAYESNALANASLKAEIAVCASDGTSPVVWGAACVESDSLGGELGTSDVAEVAWVAGDDVAVTAGQRLRFRIYVDDVAIGPLVSGYSATVSYNGATAGALGDTYVILPVAVSEQAAAGPQNVSVGSASSPALFGALSVAVVGPPQTVAVGGVAPPGITLNLAASYLAGQALVGWAGTQFGVPTAVILLPPVGAAGVPSAGAFGAVTIRTTVAKPALGVPSAQAFGAVTTAKGPVSRAVSGLVSAGAFGVPSTVIANAPQTKAVGGVSSGQGFGMPLIKGAISRAVGGVISAQSFGTVRTAVTTLGGGVTSAQSFGTVIPKTTVGVVGGGVLSGQGFGTVTIRTAVSRTVGGVASAQSFGAVILGTGLFGGGVASAQAFGTVTFRTALTRTVSGLGSAQAFGTVTPIAAGIPPQTVAVKGVTAEGFNPSSLTGLAGWYDASQLALADGAPVDPWPDLSGGNRHLISRPGYIAGSPPKMKTNELNGLPVVRYATNGDNVLTSLDSSGTYGHFFLVAKFASATFPDYNGLLSGLDGDQYLLIGTGGGAVWFPPGGGGTQEYRYDGAVSAGRQAPMQVWAQMGFSRLEPFTNFYLQIGLDRVYAPRYWHGDVAEVVAYDRQLSDVERVKVEDYLRGKWITGAAVGAQFGTVTTTVSSPSQVRAVTGIPSAQSFGPVTVKTTVAKGINGVGSAQAFGAVTIKTALSRFISGLPSGQAFGTVTATVVTPPQTRAVNGIASAQSFGAVTPKPRITRAVGGVGSAGSLGTVTAKARLTVLVAGLPSAQSFGVGNAKTNQTVTVRGIAPGYVPHIVGMYLCGQARVGYDSTVGYQRFGVPLVRVFGIRPSQPLDLILYPTTEVDGPLLTPAQIARGYAPNHLCGMHLCGQALSGYDPAALVLPLSPTVEASIVLAPADEAGEEELGEWIIRPTTEVPV